MLDTVFFVIAVLLGLMWGLFGFERKLTASDMNLAITKCALNGGLRSISAGYSITAICNNGATFKPKETT